jgi:hypothetical protein
MSAIIIVGAGFSQPAGLPLGQSLFRELLDLAHTHGLYDNILEPDISAYLEYLKASRGNTISETDIDFEDFIAYLDLEHFLWLQGKETFTSSGNKSQMAIRNLIAILLYQRQSAAPIPNLDLYREFARRLRPWDWIISFNYDTLLETVFEEVGIKYRLVPDSLTSVNEFGGIAKYPDEDVVLLKVHGSIDWFDRTEFDEWLEDRKAHGYQGLPRHPVFEHPEECDVRPLSAGPYYPSSPLTRVYRARNLHTYFQRASYLLDCPLLISPSIHKLVYLNPLREFWYGVSRIGYAETRMAIVGFSLPAHDEYLRLPLYHLVANYQFSHRGTYPDYPAKSRLVMVDKRVTKAEKAAYHKSFRFVRWANTVEYHEGFNREALNLIFEEQ